MDNDRRLHGSEKRLLRGYAPVVAAAVLFLMAAVFAPTVAPEERLTGGAGFTGGSIPPGSPPSTQPGAAGDGGDATTATTTGPGPSAPVAGAVPPAGALVCDGPQVTGDPYSPPCRQWPGGDNGGATARGVTTSEIIVSLRDPGVYDIGAVFQQLTGEDLGTAPVSREQYISTYRTLAEYFNQRFELYGRRIVIEDFVAEGSLFDEVIGAGQAAANADAIQVAEGLGAFADVSLQTIPFAEALADRGVVVTGAIYPPAEWLSQRAPFAWTFVPDCTKIVGSATSYVLAHMAGSTADYAGGDLAGKPRSLGVVYPETPVYKACGDLLVDALNNAGHPPADVRQYPLSLDGIPPTAQSIASAFANRGITTVVLLTDPLLPFFMTNTAAQNDWHPEWFIGGTAFLDLDFAGQLYEDEQWSRAFGISMLGPEIGAEATLSYAAYHSVDPSTTPDPFLARIAFDQMYQLAVGIHLAGPTLTPESFAHGLRAYESPQIGPSGKWAYPPGDFSAPQLVRVLAWDPAARSPYNDRPGHWADTGEFYPAGQVPDVAPPFP